MTFNTAAKLPLWWSKMNLSDALFILFSEIKSPLFCRITKRVILFFIVCIEDAIIYKL